MDNDSSKGKFKLPGYAKWVLAIVAIGLCAGFALPIAGLVFLMFVIGGDILAHVWPVVVIYFGGAAVLGGVIARKRKGEVSNGVWAGIFYALIALLVVLALITLNAAAHLN